MKLWIDAQLPPALAHWLSERYAVEATPLRDLGLRDAADESIFGAARGAHAVVMTKDRDFIRLLERNGQPPQVIWVTCGNTSNARMREILQHTLRDALALLQAGEPFVEITDMPQGAKTGNRISNLLE